MKQNTRYSFILAIIILFAACKSSNLVNYQLNLSANKEFKYQQTQDSEINIKVMGMNQQMINSQTFDYKVAVKDKMEDGTMLLESTIEQLAVNQMNGMANVVYDSKNPEKNQPENMTGMYESVLGSVVTSKVNKNGQVISIEGTDTMLDKMVEQMPSNPMISKEQMRNTIKLQFGDEAMSGMISYLHKIYPNKGVKTGESWISTDTITGTVEAILETTYTLKERKNGKSYIDVTGKISPNPKGDGIEMMGMRMHYKLSGTQTGQIVLDEVTGWTDQSSIDQEMGGTVKMSGELIGSMDTEMNIKTRVVTSKLQ